MQYKTFVQNQDIDMICRVSPCHNCSYDFVHSISYYILEEMLIEEIMLHISEKKFLVLRTAGTW